MNELELNQQVGVALDRDRKLENKLGLSGKFHIEHYDKDGKLLGTYDMNNGITNQGKNALLDIMFHGSTQVTTWYIGLIDNAGWSAESAGDTLTSHAGWVELTPGTDYTGNRLAWTEDAAASQAITNSTSVNFPMLTTKTVKGVFIASVATGTSGTLWATADFASTVSVVNGDTLKITYTVNG